MGNFSDLFSDSIFTLHESAIDDSIESDMGEACSAIYPPKWEDCPSCSADSIGAKPSTININGRAIPINATQNCMFCGGQGKIQEEVTESFRGLVYWRIKDPTKWARLSNTQVQISDNYIELVTYKTNIYKIMSSNFIEVALRHQPGKIYRYKLDSEPEPLGFRGKYIICLLRRAG